MSRLVHLSSLRSAERQNQGQQRPSSTILGIIEQFGVIQTSFSPNRLGTSKRLKNSAKVPHAQDTVLDVRKRQNGPWAEIRRKDRRFVASGLSPDLAIEKTYPRRVGTFPVVFRHISSLP
jgi:hypothetical protein